MRLLSRYKVQLGQGMTEYIIIVAVIASIKSAVLVANCKSALSEDRTLEFCLT